MTKFRLTSTVCTVVTCIERRRISSLGGSSVKGTSLSAGAVVMQGWLSTWERIEASVYIGRLCVNRSMWQ